MSATTAGKALAKPPIATPRPLTTLPLASFEADDLRLPVGGLRRRRRARRSSGRCCSSSVASMFLMPERDRVEPGLVGERVDHLLGGEQRLRRCRGAEPDALEEAVVAVDLLARDAAVRDRVEGRRARRVGVAGRRGRPGCGRPGELRGRLDDLRPAVLPGGVVVADDLARWRRCRRGCRSTWAGPNWSQPWSSQRMNCTRTGLPTACESSAAEIAGVVVGAVAVGARARVDLDAHRRRPAASARPRSRPRRVRALRHAEHRGLVAARRPRRAVRPDRPVRLVAA